MFGTEGKLAMFTVIRPGGHFHFHRDNPAAENGVMAALRRYHIVLATNPESWCFHDGDWQQLEVGGVYEMDPAKTHAAINFGETDRIHLVVDLEGAMP